MSPVNSNSIHTYTATTSGTEVRVLLHAQVCHLSTATAIIHTQSPHPAQSSECCCTPSGASPVNSNSIHTYTATTSGIGVRVLLHALSCVTCQQQQHKFIHSHHIRHRGQSVVARLQVCNLPTATAVIHTHHIRYRGKSVVAMVTIPRRLWSCRT